MSTDLRTQLAGLELPNPVAIAAGCGGTGRELAQFTDVAKLGAIITKSITPLPRAGHPTPRMAETPSGMLSAIGLQGPGVEAFLKRDLPWLLSRGARAIVSVAGSSVPEFAELAARLSDAAGVAAVEINLSCPNEAEGGRPFAADPRGAALAVRAVRDSLRPEIPALAKLAPDSGDLVSVAKACAAAGADGLSMINTVPGMAIDVATMRPVLAGTSGGLSGPAIRPIALRCVWEAHRALPDVPILGMGGIRTGRDALEFLLAGASAIAVGTILFHDPVAAARILRELEEEMTARGIARVADVIGLAQRGGGTLAQRVARRAASRRGVQFDDRAVARGPAS